VIERLGVDLTYFDSGQSQWIPVTADQVTRWLVAEDASDMPAWEQRVRAWALEQLAGRVQRIEG
jgi:hypothetical protein